MSDIECPYCGEDYDDPDGEISQAAFASGNATVEETCEECGKVFDLRVEWDPCYYSSKKPADQEGPGENPPQQGKDSA